MRRSTATVAKSVVVEDVQLRLIDVGALCLAWYVRISTASLVTTKARADIFEGNAMFFCVDDIPVLPCLRDHYLLPRLALQQPPSLLSRHQSADGRRYLVEDVDGSFYGEYRRAPILAAAIAEQQPEKACPCRTTSTGSTVANNINDRCSLLSICLHTQTMR